MALRCGSLIYQSRRVAHVNPAGDDITGYLTQGEVPVAGVGAHDGEAVVHGGVHRGGKDPFGLLDQCPGTERALELLSHDAGAADVAFLQDADCGNIGQRLRDGNIFRGERTDVLAEQVHRAYDLPAKSQRGGLNGFEAVFQRLC